MRRNSAFTLVEILVAVALTGTILLTGYSAFQNIMQAQSRLGATIDVQKNLFYTNEKLAKLIRDGGSIDYEEYFNRRMLGYNQSKVDTNGIPDDDVFLYRFTNPSHFGNGNVAVQPLIYYCGKVGTLTEDECITLTTSSPPSGIVDTDKESTTFITAFPTGHQPYGQYAALAYNYLNPIFPLPIKLPSIFKTGGTVEIAKRDADGKASLATQNISNVGLPELYLIKKNLDGSYDRTYFRHVYIKDPDSTATCNPSNTADSLKGCLGKIQMLKLTECDTIGVTDGIIDAWIPQCDFNTTTGLDCSLYCEYNNNAAGCTSYRTSKCPTTVDEIYTSAHEETISGSPAIPANLAWIDVTSPDMNVVRATFLPSPLKIPTLMSGASESAKSPQISVSLEVNLSTRLKNKSFVTNDKNYPRTLITTYDLSE